MDQLREHTNALKEHAANLVAKLRELEATEQENTDELAEAELRAQVGEITEAEWEATSRKSQRELAKLKESQEVIADDLIKIRDILRDDKGDRQEDDESPRTSADFDEMEFLKSVVGAPTPSSTQRVSANPVAKREPTPPATPVQPAKAAPAAAKPAAPPKAPDKPKTTPLNVSAQTESVLGITTSEATEQPKTLKCAECGSMNYSSEWYCERCGAELAAI